MKYIDEFRDGATARGLARRIAEGVRPDRRYHLMEFCGGHTHASYRHGTPNLLPASVCMIHGPGCPVCVLPIARLDMALDLAARPEVILCSYGDMLRVPGSGGRSLLKAKAAGADIRMIYSAADALTLAQRHPDHEVVFFAIGFETTTPPTALIIQQATQLDLPNFTVFCNHVLTPPAIAHLLAAPEARELDAPARDFQREANRAEVEAKEKKRDADNAQRAINQQQQAEDYRAKEAERANARERKKASKEEKAAEARAKRAADDERRKKKNEERAKRDAERAERKAQREAKEAAANRLAPPP